MVQSVTLEDADAGTRAQILTGFGFNCFSFVARDSLGEVELIWSEPDFETGEKRPSGSGIPILFPFPGRLAGMTYLYEGKSYPLESDDGRGNGIHGFVHCRPWKVTAQTSTSVTGRFQASVDAPELLERWPADFLIECTYRLSANRLECEMTFSNPDEKPLPCGLGSHPYFRMAPGGASADQTKVTVPAKREWMLNNMLPTGEQEPLQSPIRNGASFTDLQLDNVLTELEFEGDWFTAEIHDEARDRRVQVRFDSVFRECVVYTPPHREAICIEPYTCLPGPGGNTDYEHGWRELPSGESVTGRMQIELGV